MRLSGLLSCHLGLLVSVSKFCMQNQQADLLFAMGDLLASMLISSFFTVSSVSCEFQKFLKWMKGFVKKKWNLRER